MRQLQTSKYSYYTCTVCISCKQFWGYIIFDRGVFFSFFSKCHSDSVIMNVVIRWLEMNYFLSTYINSPIVCCSIIQITSKKHVKIPLPIIISSFLCFLPVTPFIYFFTDQLKTYMFIMFIYFTSLFFNVDNKKSLCLNGIHFVLALCFKVGTKVVVFRLVKRQILRFIYFTQNIYFSSSEIASFLRGSGLDL